MSFLLKKRNIYLYLIYIIILIFMLEYVSRIIVNDYQRSILTYDNQLIWKFVPNLKIMDLHIPFVLPLKSDLYTNSLGFRDSNHPLKNENNSRRILVIGDSSPAGLHISKENIFPRYLETKLNQNSSQEFEIFNFGITTYATDQEYILLKNIGLKYSPEIVILVVAPNDIRESFVKNLFYLDKGELVINKSNKAFNLNLKNRLFWSLSIKSKVFFMFQKLLGLNYGTSKFMYDTVTEGVFFKNDKGLGPDEVLFLKNETDEMKSAILLFQALIKNINKICINNNVKLIIVNLPIKLQFDGSLNNDIFDTLKVQKILKNIAAKNSIMLLDLYPAVNNSMKPLDYYLDKEYHMNQKGHKLVGDELYYFLIKENLLNGSKI